MAEPVASQFILFAYTILTGMFAGLLYDFCAGLLQVCRVRKGMAVHAADILYWLALTVVVFTVLWYYNQGEVRFYILLGLGAGAWLYHCLFRRPARRVIGGFLARAVWLVQWTGLLAFRLLVIILYPFRLIYLALIFPFRLAAQIPGRAARALSNPVRRLVPPPLKNLYRRTAFRWHRLRAAWPRKR